MYYFSDMGDKTESERIPPVPRPKRPPITRMEAVYLGILQHWYAHRRDPPRLRDLSNLTKPRRTEPAIRAALLNLEDKGYVKRNSDGRFEVVA